MLTRKDGTPITPDNLTDEDVALSPWNVLDNLATEEDIALYLKAALIDIEEGECDASFFFEALADVAKARLINQLANNSGIDRQTLCDMFLDDHEETPTPEISHDVIVKVTKALVTAPLPV